MFLAEVEPVHSHCPVQETGLTPHDIQELLSLIHSNPSSSGSSEGSSGAVYSADDERKKRRKISNRESARRSRFRKKEHLENLTDQLNRLKIENRDLKNRLDFILNQCDHLWKENVELNSEFIALSTRLSNLCQILGYMQMLSQ